MATISSNRLRKIKEQLSSHDPDGWWWIDSWMAVFRCFTCLLTCISEKLRKISHILFFGKSY